jgi:hypothetical protein
LSGGLGWYRQRGGRRLAGGRPDLCRSTPIPDFDLVIPLGVDRRPFLVVTEGRYGALRFKLVSEPPAVGAVYGCFPHLGKGVASQLGIACSDGYTATYRRGTWVPSNTRSLTFGGGHELRRRFSTRPWSVDSHTPGCAQESLSRTLILGTMTDSTRRIGHLSKGVTLQRAVPGGSSLWKRIGAGRAQR